LSRPHAKAGATLGCSLWYRRANRPGSLLGLSGSAYSFVATPRCRARKLSGDGPLGPEGVLVPGSVQGAGQGLRMPKPMTGQQP
jgi:hypothetical protein